MSGCVHKVKLSVRRPEKCKLNLSVSRYKDRIVAPDEYTGATTITPSDNTQTIPTKGKLVRANVTVLPAPTEPFSTTENGQFTPSEGNVGFSSVMVDVKPTLESLTVDSLTQHGTFLPAGDGFSQVTVEDEWDGSLIPDENETGFFHCKHVDLLSTDILMLEGYGGGYRWASVKSNYPAFVQFNRDYGVGSAETPPVHVRVYLVPTDDTSVVIGGPAWGADGSVTTTNYSFKGEYLKYKVIHAS